MTGSEETGSREENASDQESRAPFRFNRNEKDSSRKISFLHRGFTMLRRDFLTQPPLSKWTHAVVLIAIVGVGFALWPLYRKFFINEWLERMVRSQPIIFEPDCPDLRDHFQCNDRYTIVYSKNEKNLWCEHVRKNDEPAEKVICDADSAPAQAGKWRRLNIDGRDLQFSWRGRVVVPVLGYPIGWFATPESVARRIANPLAMK